MTDEDLIAVLKDWPYMGETYAKIAVDRIEELVKEQARLHAGWHEANVSELIAKLKLAKAVEALRSVQLYGVITHDALVLLAELEGKE